MIRLLLISSFYLKMSKNISAKYFKESDYGKEPILGREEVTGFQPKLFVLI